MIAVYATTLLVGLASAVLPVVPVEPYLVGVVASTAAHPVVCGVAAGLGQAAGKVLLLLGARGVLRWAILRREPRRRPSRPVARHRRPSRLLAALDRPRWTVPIVFLSAVTGVPPLLLTTVYAARTTVSPIVFGIACLLGRSVRFVAIAVAPELLIR